MVSVRNFLWFMICICLALPCAAEEAAQTQINRIEWCIHAYCWSLFGPEPPKDSDAELWRVQFSRELRLHEQRMARISEMKSDEALVIYPIGNPALQQELVEHAKKELGPRAVVITRQTSGEAIFAGVDDAVRRFIEDPDWPERDQWIHNMLTDFGKRPEPPGIADQMLAEVQETCDAIGYDWSPSAIEIAYYQRMIAYDIQQALDEAGLSYDPASVEAVAYGEGFEECAMSWKSMVGNYMGLKKPIENDYERSVSGSLHLAHATFKERIALSHHVRVFLWELDDGRNMALFARAGSRLKDPYYEARFSTTTQVGGRTFSLEVWSSFKNLFWESKSHTVVPATTVTVTAFTAIRRGGGDGFFYLVASGEPYEDFRERMSAAVISPMAD